VEGSVSEMLWSDERIQALIQQNNDDYGTSSVLDDALWQMRNEYQAVLAQAGRTIEAQAQRIAELEGSLKKVEWW
jgi:hypothetical protein